MSAHKFPKTPHLFSSNATDLDNIVLDIEQTNDVLGKDVVVQEKLDGMCLGFSFDNGSPVIQNRRGSINLDSKFNKKIKEWYAMHEDELKRACADKHVLFGEWLYWRHSISYDSLPSFFMAYDMLDKNSGVFLSTTKVAEKLSGTNIRHNPVIFSGRLSLDELKSLVGQSQYGHETMEGVYVRADGEYSNAARYKFVRPGFTNAIKDNWRTKHLVANHSVDPIEAVWSSKSAAQLLNPYS